MSTVYYPNIVITPNLGLSLIGENEVTADNFILLDAAFGSGGSTIQINGAIVNGPNFNSSTPAAPVGDTNVVFQVDAFGNVSAYVPLGITLPNVKTKSSNYNAVANDFVLCDTSGGPFTVTLPLSALNKASTITVKKISSDTNALTIACSGADTLDGQPTQFTTQQNTAVESLADGVSHWEIY